MPYDGLLQEVERSSKEEIREVRERTDAEIRALREDAENRAWEIRRRHLHEAERLAETERIKTLFQARADVSSRIAQTRHEVYEGAFEEATERLRDIREHPEYPAIFQALLHEAVSFFENRDLVIHVDPADEEICRKAADGMGLSCEILPDIQCTGGLIVETGGGRVRLENTIDSRLDRARESMKTEVFSALFEG
ncbi:MAG: V-type ATP synthase subunit E [Methanomicrobiales archaeon]